MQIDWIGSSSWIKALLILELIKETGANKSFSHSYETQFDLVTNLEPVSSKGLFRTRFFY